MAKSKFTPGPYRVSNTFEGDSDEFWIYSDMTNLGYVANSNMDPEEIAANAELWADAPRLLEVLDTLYDCVDHEKLLPSQLDAYHRARELLAKHGG